MLQAEKNDLEKRLNQLATDIQNLKKQRSGATEDVDRVMDLEQRLERAEQAKARLAKEFDMLRARAAASSSRSPKNSPCRSTPSASARASRICARSRRGPSPAR